VQDSRGISLPTPRSRSFGAVLFLILPRDTGPPQARANSSLSQCSSCRSILWRTIACRSPRHRGGAVEGDGRVPPEPAAPHPIGRPCRPVGTVDRRPRLSTPRDPHGAPAGVVQLAVGARRSPTRIALRAVYADDGTFEKSTRLSMAGPSTYPRAGPPPGASLTAWRIGWSGSPSRTRGTCTRPRSAPFPRRGSSSSSGGP
jgi:hypothetical protein